jgi:gamma-glutamyltranspeptidase
LCGPYANSDLQLALPAAGGVTLLQMLGVLETFDLAALGADSS